MKWTKEDDLFLIDNYNKITFWDLAPNRFPNISFSLIKKRASYIGLRLTKEQQSKIRSETNIKFRESRKDFKGYKEMGGSYICALRRHAKDRGIDHPLLDQSQESNMYLYGLYNGFCKLSGLKIRFKKTGEKLDNTASLDRINPKFGYIKNNVQWVHKEINELKWDLTNEEFLSFVVDIYRNKIKNE